MRVTFLGTGTSQGVPVIACQCAVCQSTDTRDKRLRTSVMIQFDNDTNVVIDTGPDFRYQMLREDVRKLDAVLVTHAHKDHIAGMDDLRAFNYQQQQSIPIYGTAITHESLKREFYYAFGEQKYPGVPRLELRPITTGDAFRVGTQSIMPIEVMHYKMPVMGFRIGNFAYITDAKTISEESKALLKGIDTLVVNALQEEPHISHFTKEEAIAFAEEIQTKSTYLTHISHRFGKHEHIERTLPEGIRVAYDRLVIDVQ
ncbi:MBL fold metallo-hydrolase [Sphingobacterium haloxyli]|uniref:MBL fold metallo-hydrolase n=1 Tax=Sphingobacterium haloxyli TaxID=2100533 RepID=A0A2S9J402_9SPHI|nr:MBL fold metallo-hydrolase [Sphingobacterium haloxyli]PRD47511.1 MBL fold metallo-hydrolase [Sphingobacterium haloxyli]